MYLFGFSGPPHCGKDSIARTIAEMITAHDLPIFNIDVVIMSLAKPMRKIGMEFLGLDSADDEAYEDAKQRHHALLRHREPRPGLSHQQDSLREFMIWLSEKAIKPRYGFDFWARKMKWDLDGIWKTHCLVLVPDIGFQSEVDFFTKELGEDNVTIAQVMREGCTFSGDSRSYILSDKSNLSLMNNMSLEWAAQECLAHMQSIGWEL